MKSRLSSFFQRPAIQKVISLSLAVASLALLIRALVDVIQGSCMDPVRVEWGAELTCFSWPIDSLPLVVAGGFWGIGLIIAHRRGFSINVLFFFFCSAMLSSGLVSGIALDWAVRLFYFTMAWLPPILLRFHLEWLEWPHSRLERGAVWVFSLIALAWSLPFVAFSTQFLFQAGWLGFLRFGVRMTLFLSLLVVLVLLVISYRIRSLLSARPRIRLAVFGTILGLAPLVLLYFIPNMLGQVDIIATFYLPFLIFIPLSYGYSILRIKPSTNDRLVFQVAVVYLLALLVASLYLILNELMSKAAPSIYAGWVSLRLGAVALLALGALLFRKPISGLMDWVLYGPQIPKFRLLEQFTETLAFVQDRNELWNRMGSELAAMLPISGIALFLKTGELLHFEGQKGFSGDGSVYADIPLNNPLIERLQHAGSRFETLAILLNDGEKKDKDAGEFSSLPSQAIVMPLLSGEMVLGLLFIGSKPDGEFFREEEKRLFSILGHQAAIAAHNVLLMEDLRARQSELEQAYYRLTMSHEEEQRRLARDLHDDALQELLTTRYRIQTLQRKIEHPASSSEMSQYEDSLDNVQQNLLKVIAGLRGLIGELRPAGLEDLGLVAALQGYLMQVEREAGEVAPRIVVDLDESLKDEDPNLALCLFRAAQEGLRNALRHAQAQEVQVTLKKTDSMLRLDLKDDGVGFSMPEKMSQLARLHHYGLLGIEERVRGVGGRCTVRSTPGKGTHLIVEVPASLQREKGEKEE